MKSLITAVCVFLSSCLARHPSQSPTTIETIDPFQALQGVLFEFWMAFISDIFSKTTQLPADAKVSIQQQIVNHGLSFESFEVTTEDGYINTIMHVWAPESTPMLSDDGKQRVAFLQHGLTDIAGTWFFQKPEKAPAYSLAKAGYDVWLGNNRGTAFSYKHVKLSCWDSAYWQYSFNEMGKYDLPANLNFVLEKTKADKLTYIGHSQGTTQFWIANILYEDIGQKVDTFIGFAPVMFVGHQTSSFVIVAIKFYLDVLLEDTFRSVLFWGHRVVAFVGPWFMHYIPRTTWAVIGSVVGYDFSNHMDFGRIPMFANNDIGGTGTMNLRHWEQNMKSGRFADYHGKDYDTSQLASRLANTDIALFIGGNDALAQPEDFAMLLPLLPASKTTVFSILDYNHVDYMGAGDTEKFILPNLYNWISSKHDWFRRTKKSI